MKLTPEEAAFCLDVFSSPGRKIDAVNAVWKGPEHEGLVESVGSFKWLPTHKLNTLLNAALLPRPAIEPAAALLVFGALDSYMHGWEAAKTAAGIDSSEWTEADVSAEVLNWLLRHLRGVQ